MLMTIKKVIVGVVIELLVENKSNYLYNNNI